MQKHSPCAGYKRARALLRDDFISPQEIMLSRAGIIYPHEQLDIFCKFLPPREELELCRETNRILIAGPADPLTLNDIRKLKRSYFSSERGGWYAREAFAKHETVQPSWISIPKELVAVDESGTSTHIISPYELDIAPNAAIVAWCLTTYHAVRGIYLFPHSSLETSSVSADGRRVSVGPFGPNGLHLKQDL